jgi:hypothetical protein
MYERTIAAATAETASKFKLAEALALDIPPIRTGPPANAESTLHVYLSDARRAIIKAGGEDRSTGTLQHYRLTALWVRQGRQSIEDVNVSNVEAWGWVKGASFTAHSEARLTGMSYREFRELPKKTVDVIRRDSGKAGTDGPPAKVAARAVEEMSPGERAGLAQSILADPDVAAQATGQLGPEAKAGLVEGWLADPEQGTKVRAAVSKPIVDHDVRTERDLTARRRREADDGKRPDFESPEAVLRAIASANQYLSDMRRLPMGLSLAARERLAEVNTRVWEVAGLWKDAAPANVSDEAAAWLRDGAQ